MRAKYNEWRCSIGTLRNHDSTVLKEGQPHTYRKRVGSTVYIVTVHYSDTSQETAEDKLKRLISREVENSA